ncbi:hypothetical protein [Streptomyces sp. NBC_00829]|uniref:hypothetical protein n=1 Tax=Streptomyces sp. NBC_00829 TaxID=2903679 RepID=UPI0038691283|nr:hypothetical protein OG293_34295 [Streptomyces sp. NBC_00829]
MTAPDPQPRPASEPGAAAPATAARAGDTAAARLKERIYATITLAAVVVALSDAHVGPQDAALTVTVTALGVWLATLVADEQSHRAVSGRGANRAEIRTALYVSAPLLLSAVGPLVLIGVSALGAMELDTALLISAGVEVAALFLWGWRTGLRMGNGPLSALVSGLVDTVIGVGVVAVKLLAGH